MPATAAAVAGITPTTISITAPGSGIPRRASVSTTSLGATLSQSASSASNINPLSSPVFFIDGNAQPPDLPSVFFPPPLPEGLLHPASMMAPISTALLQMRPDTMNLVGMTSFEAASADEVASRLFAASTATSPALAAVPTTTSSGQPLKVLDLIGTITFQKMFGCRY